MKTFLTYFSAFCFLFLSSSFQLQASQSETGKTTTTWFQHVENVGVDMLLLEDQNQTSIEGFGLNCSGKAAIFLFEQDEEDPSPSVSKKKFKSFNSDCYGGSTHRAVIRVKKMEPILAVPPVFVTDCKYILFQVFRI